MQKEEDQFKRCVLCFWILQAALQDSQVELETYKQTRQGLDEMYNVVWMQYKEEKRIRQVQCRQCRLKAGLFKIIFSPFVTKSK